jgi:hypothetical protein
VIEDATMAEDPIVSEVRRVREQIFAEYGHDLGAYVDSIIVRQEEKKRQGFRYASPPPTRSRPSRPDTA